MRDHIEPRSEVTLNSGGSEHLAMATGVFEFACFAAFLCWVFSERVLVMVDVLSARVQRTGFAAFGSGASEAGGETALRRAVERQRRRRDANDNDLSRREQQDKQYRIEMLLAPKEKPFRAVMPGDMRASNSAIGMACERCTPKSRESWVSGRHNRSHVINILDIGRNSAVTGGFFSRRFCDIIQAYSVHKWDYPQVADTVMLDDRLQLAIEQTTQEDVARQKEGDQKKVTSMATVKKQVEKRAKDVLDNMKSTLSDFFLRLTSWLLHKILPRIAPGGAAARAAAIASLRAAGSEGTSAHPLILVPLHRSHLDYILVSLVLLNCEVRPPLVAAGDNLRIPFFGWLLRYLGAFFIRRRVEPNGSNSQRDHVYRATLRAYILRCLQARHNLEFFIEGGRTRSGKPQMPKGGILSVIVDAYIEGTIDDALLVPVSMNYEKLVDGNFVREQLGIPKEMETFWSAIKGIWHVLNSNYGSIRVDFNQPFSLRELVRSFQQKNYSRDYLNPMEYNIDGLLAPSNNEHVTMQQLSHKRQISTTHSCSSLYGDEMSEEDLGLVEAIARHIVYDASKATAIMSTNVVGWCLLTQFREGCFLEELVTGVEKLSGRLLRDGRDLGFSGETVDVVNHAIDVLGPGLVKKEREDTSIKVQPVCLLPNVIELSYYSSCLLPHYALQAIVVTAAEVLEKTGSSINQSTLFAESLCLCEVMSQEFLLAPPCRRLTDCVSDAIDQLLERDLIRSNESNTTRNLWAISKQLDIDNEEDNVSSYVDKWYSLTDTPDAQNERRYLQTSLQPLIEAYVITSYWLTHSDLIRQSDEEPNSITEREFVKTIISEMTTAFEQGRLKYGDALSTDAIKNCLRLHKLWGVVDLSASGRDRIITLNKGFNSMHRLRSVYSLISKFKLDLGHNSNI